MDDVIVAVAERELEEIPERVARVEEGLLHETYELFCDGGEYVLQFSSDADEDREDALSRGLNCYVVLQNSEIPVPEVVTEEVRELDGRRYVLVEKLPGETGERNVSPERVRNAGRYLAKIHDVRSFDNAGGIRFEDDGPTVHGFQDGSLNRRTQHRIEESVRVLREGGGSRRGGDSGKAGKGGLEAAGNEVEGVFDRIGGYLPEDFRPVLCHDDYSPDNVLFRGSEVTGILDFDRAYAGHDHRDLVKAANGFWMHDPCSDWDVRAEFYEGYREVNELGNSFERHEPMYRVETLAGTVAGLLEMGELSEYEREFYSERIRETVERVKET